MAKGTEYVKSSDVAARINEWMNEGENRSVRDIAREAGLETKTVSAVYGQQRPLVTLFLADKILVPIGHHVEELEHIVQKEKKGILSAPVEKDPFQALRDDIKAFGWRLRVLDGGEGPRRGKGATIETWFDRGKATIYVAAPEEAEEYDLVWRVARAFAEIQGYPSRRGDWGAGALLDAWAYSYQARFQSLERARQQLRRISRRLDGTSLGPEDSDKLAYAVWPILTVTPKEERSNILCWFDGAGEGTKEKIEEIAREWGWKAPDAVDKAWKYFQSSPF